jgi:hypothetical protein
MANPNDEHHFSHDDHLLMADFFHLKKEVKAKNAEIEKLNDIRERLESEIRDLTALLFEVWLMVFFWCLLVISVLVAASV